MKVVINACYGGFGLSEAAVRRYFEIKGKPLLVEPRKQWEILGPQYFTVPPEQRVKSLEGEAWHAASLEERKAHNEAWDKQTFYDRDTPRDDPALVQVVEELGGAASDRFAKLKVVEIPDGVEWEISEYDGREHVAEKHRVWG